MNRLPRDKQERVVAALVEGNAIRATVRMTGVAKNTVAKLLVDLGAACAAYHDEHVRDVRATRIQCDEIWSLCYSKQKNVPAEHQGELGYGDVWTWTALDADSKLILSYMVGLRDAGYATEFMRDIKSRVENRVQLTTDGLKLYAETVEDAFGGDVDYAMLVKMYGPEKNPTNEVRYSPPVCLASRKTPMVGNPDPKHVSTSYVQRQNLTMRMSMRRFTRLTNAFSKKVENLAAAVALHFMHYNYCRLHRLRRITPAMAAGLSDHVWEASDLLDLLDPGRPN